MPRQTPPTHRLLRGRRAYVAGQDAESLAAAALTAEGWQILAQRCRTEAGEIDLIAEREGLLAFIEVKARPSLAEAAFALGPRQRSRLVAAAGAWIAEHPGHGLPPTLAMARLGCALMSCWSRWMAPSGASPMPSGSKNPKPASPPSSGNSPPYRG